jgi:hypothetical protein
MKTVGSRVTELVKERLTAESEGLGDKFVSYNLRNCIRIKILIELVA